VTADCRRNNGMPDRAPDTDMREEPVVTEAQPPTLDGEKKNDRPESMLALIEYAYGLSGRRLNLTHRDFSDLSVDEAAAQAEIDAVRRLAIADPFLAVPPALLAAVAEHEVNEHVVRRVLELVRVALASHKLFEPHLVRLIDAQAKPALTANEISETAGAIGFDALGLRKAAEFAGPARERLRVNAVTTFELFRVLGRRWTLDQFVEDMTALVWRAPRHRSDQRTAALLATAKSTDALGQLSLHLGRLIRDSKREAGDSRAQAAYQQRLAEQAQASGKALSADLDSARAHAADLTLQIEELSRRLSQEQSSRVVDKSHLVDDYETLRTQVIRRLTAQVELLGDSLHALRRGSTSVAEEFVDRALSAINAEVKRLKDVDGGTQ
jgi:hypothetical protein